MWKTPHAMRSASFGDAMGILLPAAKAKDDVGAGLSQQLSRRRADPTRATRHDGTTSSQGQKIRVHVMYDMR